MKLTNLQKMAETGDIHSLKNMAIGYAKGWGVKKDFKKSREYFKISIDCGTYWTYTEFLLLSECLDVQFIRDIIPHLEKNHATYIFLYIEKLNRQRGITDNWNIIKKVEPSVYLSPGGFKIEYIDALFRANNTEAQERLEKLTNYYALKGDKEAEYRMALIQLKKDNSVLNYETAKFWLVESIKNGSEGATKKLIAIINQQYGYKIDANMEYFSIDHFKNFNENKKTTLYLLTLDLKNFIINYEKMIEVVQTNPYQDCRILYDFFINELTEKDKNRRFEMIYFMNCILEISEKLKIGTKEDIHKFFLQIPKPEKEKRMCQEASLATLLEFDKLCKKNNIQYVIGFGTLLGATRHSGFIPWDDDVDIIMTRSELKKLCKIIKGSGLRLEKTFSANYKCISYHLTMEYTGAILVDIFVLDFLPNNDKNNIDYYLESKNQMKKEIEQVLTTNKEMIDFKHYPPIYELIESYVKKYDNYEGNFLIWGIDMITAYKPYFIFNYEDIYPTRQLSFENHLLPVPNNANVVLTNIYGNIYRFPKDLNTHVHFKLNVYNFSEIADYKTIKDEDIGI